jgi:hypothetical protein
MRQKKLTKIYKNFLPVVILGLFSFLVNFHYGFIGVMPMDNFVLYNGGYRVLNGFVPFNDYWLVTGPLLDYLNAFVFSLNGVSWKSYIFHSSFINLILALLNYKLFLELNLNNLFSIFYSALISVLFYPIVGTPFVDHHSTFFLLISFYFFIFGIINKKKIYFFFIPFLLCLSFLSKQTPAFYGLVALILLNLTYLIIYKNKKLLFWTLLSGSFAAIFFLIIFFYLTKINFNNFITQYISYASTIGNFRMSNYNFNILNFLLDYKFINILLFFLIYNFIKFFYEKEKNIDVILIIITIIFLTITLLFHQYYTLNQNYIFFLIPLLTGVIHSIEKKKKFSKNYFLIIIFFICIFSTYKYHMRFNEHRKFNELEKVDLSKAVDAEILHPSLKGLKWITHYYPNNPKEEIDELKKIIEIINLDRSNKALITEYQILAPILKMYDYSPNQWHHPSVSFPLRKQKYYETYKEYFVKSLKKNNIENIYEVSNSSSNILQLVIDKKCFSEERLTNILIKYNLKTECNDFKSN